MYKVQEVAKIAGVSVRTLHHYDSIGLMKPSNIGSNRYRYYSDEDLKLLQHILFFKEIGFSLKKIQELVAEGFDPEHSLAQHVTFLRQKQERLDRLTENAELTLRELAGLETLTNEKRFDAFANEKSAENITRYKTALKQEVPKIPVAAGVAEASSESVFSQEPVSAEEFGSIEELPVGEDLIVEETSVDEAISLPENSTSIEKTEAIEETAPSEDSALEEEFQVEETVPEKEKEDLEEINREGNRIYTSVASLMYLPPAHEAVQEEMEAYYILLNRFYNCNPKMFRGLGDLYVKDSRFSHNIDQHGAGLSAYLKEAMYAYAEGVENA